MWRWLKALRKQFTGVSIAGFGFSLRDGADGDAEDLSKARPPTNGAPPVSTGPLGPPSTSPHVRVFETRTEAAQDVISRIITTASENEQCLHFLGIAHTVLFGADPILNATFRKAIENGTEVKLIFVDPESPPAARRAQHERERLATLSQISGNIKLARELKSLFRDRVFIRLVPDVSCFLCFNEDEMVIHPYFNSATGPATLSLSVSSEDQTFENAKAHFEKLWVEKAWVLFDLGNVLIDFDHRRVSHQLLKFFPAGG